MKKQGLLISVLLILAFTMGIGARYTLNSRLQAKRPAYTIIWQATDYDTEGKATPYYTETRYVSSSGKWHSIKQYANGRSEEMFAEAGNGVFLKHGEKMIFVSGYASPPEAVSEEELRKSPNYLRTETVMGQLTIVVKAANGADNGPEFYRAPALGGEIIKTVLPQGGGAKTVIEPISIVSGEPDESLLRIPKGLAVDNQYYEKMHPRNKQ